MYRAIEHYLRTYRNSEISHRIYNTCANKAFILLITQELCLQKKTKNKKNMLTVQKKKSYLPRVREHMVNYRLAYLYPVINSPYDSGLW